MNNGLERTINCWGTSITQSSYPNHLREMLINFGGFRIINNEGLGGQTAEEIAIRFGAIPVLLELNQSEIGGSSATITNLTGAWDNYANNKQFLSMADTREIVCSGHFETGYNISRAIVKRTSIDGNPKQETYKLWKVDDNTVQGFYDTQIRFYSDKANAVSKDINIFEIVQNQPINVHGQWPPVALPSSEFEAVCDRTIFLIQSCIDKLEDPKRFLVCGETGYGQTNGIDGYYWMRDEIDRFESRIKEAFKDNYVDQLSNPTLDELAEIGYTPTANDLLDLANGIMPRGIMIDNIHRTTKGSRLLALRFFKALKQKGYIL